MAMPRTPSSAGVATLVACALIVATGSAAASAQTASRGPSALRRAETPQQLSKILVTLDALAGDVSTDHARDVAAAKLSRAQCAASLHRLGDALSSIEDTCLLLDARARGIESQRTALVHTLALLSADTEHGGERVAERQAHAKRLRLRIADLEQEASLVAKRVAIRMKARARAGRCLCASCAGADRDMRPVDGTVIQQLQGTAALVAKSPETHQRRHLRISRTGSLEGSAQHAMTRPLRISQHGNIRHRCHGARRGWGPWNPG